MSTHPYLRRSAIVALVFGLTVAGSPASSKVTKLTILSRESPTYNGQSFGTTGQYEKIIGTASGEIDPADRRNAIITDINLAPRNANGKVTYAATFTLINRSILRREMGCCSTTW